jgi:glucose-6-phosphate isomerase
MNALANFSAGSASFERHLTRLVEDQFASRLGSGDSRLWGTDAEPEAARRLGWIDLTHTSRPLIPEIERVRDALHARGLTHLVLCGMGGSSLAPEVICRAAGVELTVLDSSSPDMVRSALADRLAESIVVIASKSGGTVETDSQMRVYEAALTEAGHNPADHIIVITDPGSPLAKLAAEAGYRTFLADSQVGGRYSALTAFGLVPSGLAGAPIGTLLDEADVIQQHLFTDSVENLGLRLGALLGSAALQEVDKLAIRERGINWGLGDWIEQLVAESTGKDGTGILPVVTMPELTDDALLVVLGDPEAPAVPSAFSAGIDLPLGAQMLLWEVATAAAGAMLDIDPFDQPDVESAKKASRDLLTRAAERPAPDAVDGAVELRGTGEGTLAEAIDDLLAKIDPVRGYLAIQAYLDRWRYADLAQVGEQLSARIGRPATFGWGPRFLHSTGQYHKGGPPTGVFLQVTAEPIEDLAIPGRDFTLGSFIASQAAGDAAVLRDHGRPVLSLHLTDVDEGIQQLREALR